MVLGVEAGGGAEVDDSVQRCGCGFERRVACRYIGRHHGRSYAGVNEMHDGRATYPEQQRNGSEETHERSFYYDALASRGVADSAC